jgi:hypothetical protein
MGRARADSKDSVRMSWSRDAPKHLISVSNAPLNFALTPELSEAISDSRALEKLAAPAMSKVEELVEEEVVDVVCNKDVEVFVACLCISSKSRRTLTGRSWSVNNVCQHWFRRDIFCAGSASIRDFSA